MGPGVVVAAVGADVVAAVGDADGAATGAALPRSSGPPLPQSPQSTRQFALTKSCSLAGPVVQVSAVNLSQAGTSASHVGASVGVAVGPWVGCMVGAADGAALGFNVGPGLGLAVGAVDGRMHSPQSTGHCCCSNSRAKSLGFVQFGGEKLRHSGLSLSEQAGVADTDSAVAEVVVVALVAVAEVLVLEVWVTVEVDETVVVGAGVQVEPLLSDHLPSEY